MNNDLAQFSEERLIEIAGGGFKSTAKFDEQMALARIVLAAKQAKPAGYIAEVSGNRVGVLRGLPMPEIGSFIYTTPQPAHAEQKGCQWNPDENSVYSTGCGNEWQFTDGGLEDNKIKFCPYCSGKIAAPKPEGE